MLNKSWIKSGITLAFCFLLSAVAQANDLGQYKGSRFGSDSLNNPDSWASSSSNPNSINNPRGLYGSPHSSRSANNPYATQPPQVVDRHGKVRGHLGHPNDPGHVDNPRNPNRPSLINPYAEGLKVIGR